jgi:hypothetical protein
MKYKKDVEQARWQLLHEGRQGLRYSAKMCRDCVVPRKCAGIALFRENVQGLRCSAKMCRDCVVPRKCAGIALFRENVQGLRSAALEIGPGDITMEGGEGSKKKSA